MKLSFWQRRWFPRPHCSIPISAVKTSCHFVGEIWRVFFKFFYIQKCRTLHIVTPGGCHWWKCYRNCLRSQRGHLVRYLPQRASRCLQGQGGGHFHPLGQGRLKDIGNDLKGSDHLDRTSFSPLAGCFVNSLYFFSSNPPSTIFNFKRVRRLLEMCP